MRLLVLRSDSQRHRLDQTIAFNPRLYGGGNAVSEVCRCRRSISTVLLTDHPGWVASYARQRVCQSFFFALPHPFSLGGRRGTEAVTAKNKVTRFREPSSSLEPAAEGGDQLSVALHHQSARSCGHCEW